MTITASLYELFSVPPTCTDDELRRAYHDAILKHHPDKNPHQIQSATAKTQQLVSAYAELKDFRASQSAEFQDSEHSIRTTAYAEGLEFIIQFSFDDGVDTKDIANRKMTFRNEWERFQQSPFDPITALRLVHAAFRAEQQDYLSNLLLNPILLDSASLLLSLVEKDDACETLIKWSGILHDNQRLSESVQILEDALATGITSLSVADELRRLHYAWAQYANPTTGNKATPEERVKHLRRILELGFKYDYIYKLIAQAYHDLGDVEQARTYLRQAYELNPELSGAVRISRALGFSQPARPSPRKRKSPNKYKYSHPRQIPSSPQIYEWVQSRNWDAVMEFANPQDYSPRILSQARGTFRQIADSLADCGSPKAIDVLTALLNFDYYWDVSEAAITALSKIGNKQTLDLLEKYKTGNSRVHAHWKACISYLRARLSNQPSPATKSTPTELLARAKEAFAKEDYGQTRVLMENLLANIAQSDFVHPEDSNLIAYLHTGTNIEQSDTILIEAKILLARACAAMNDVKTSIEVIRPILPELPEESRRTIYEELVSWLWSDLVFQQYTSINDENYQLALEIHFELALTAKTPDNVLKNLKSLTRWLELLGADSTVQWIRQLIRTEAPGTQYVDAHNREQYIRNVDLSPYMKDCLFNFDKRLNAHAVSKLQQVLESAHNLENPRLLLEHNQNDATRPA